MARKRKSDAPLPEQHKNSGASRRGRPFPKGVSGNPAGRQPGARSKVSLLVEGILEANANEITAKLVEKALDGSIHALQLCLDRLAPIRRDRTISIDLPSFGTSADVVAGFDHVLNATAAGQISVSEAQGLGQILELRRRAIESSLLEQRLAAIEKTLSGSGHAAL